MKKTLTKRLAALSLCFLMAVGSVGSAFAAVQPRIYECPSCHASGVISGSLRCNGINCPARKLCEYCPSCHYVASQGGVTVQHRISCGFTAWELP